MTQNQFEQVQKIIDRVRTCEKEMEQLSSKFGNRPYLRKLRRKIECWREDSWSDYFLFALTDEDIQLLIEARKERIRLLKTQLAAFGVNVE